MMDSEENVTYAIQARVLTDKFELNTNKWEFVEKCPTRKAAEEKAAYWISWQASVGLGILQTRIVPANEVLEQFVQDNWPRNILQLLNNDEPVKEGWHIYGGGTRRHHYYRGILHNEHGPAIESHGYNGVERRFYIAGKEVETCCKFYPKGYCQVCKEEK